MIAAFTLMESFYRARRDFRSLRGEKLRTFQDTRARAIVAYAVTHAPFYARHYRDHDIRVWRTLPTTDKRLMMDNFGEFNTRRIALDDALCVALDAERTRDFSATIDGLTVGLSSGTSGHRSVFLGDRVEMASWVGVVLARLLPPFRGRGYTVTLFSMSGSNLYDDLRGHWLRFHHHDLATPLDAAVSRLNVEQPDLLCGPPSYLAALSERRITGELRVAPRKLVSVAEVLEPHIAEALQQRFGCPVHQIYQCSEGLIGISCRLGRLHVQEDVVASQYEQLSPDNAAMALVITDLRHRSQPIIRYRLGDIVTLASPDACECGSAFQVIDQVEGRSDDICEFVKRDGSLHPVFPATIRRMVLLASEGIADYDAVQERPSQLRVRLTLSRDGDPAIVARAVRASIVAGLQEQGVVAADIQIESGDREPTAGKRRRVRCLRSTDPTNAEH